MSSGFKRHGLEEAGSAIQLLMMNAEGTLDRSSWQGTGTHIILEALNMGKSIRVSSQFFTKRWRRLWLTRGHWDLFRQSLRDK